MWDLTVPGNGDHDFYVVAVQQKSYHTYYALAGGTIVLVHNSGEGLTPEQIKSIQSYEDLLTAARHQLPGGNIVLVWDSLSVHLRAFITAQAWLQVFQLPSYAPDLNPVEGIWSSLKRGQLANRAFTSFAHLLQVTKTGLRKIQRQPGLIEGCLAGTGLSLKPDEPTS